MRDIPYTSKLTHTEDGKSMGNRKFLEEVAGRYLPTQPSNGVFLDMTAAFLRSPKWS